MRLFVYHADEDDPKKCSARKLARFGFVRLETNIRRTPRGTILLNPFAEKSFTSIKIDCLVFIFQKKIKI